MTSFVVTRTSASWGWGVKPPSPCEGAFLKKATSLDRRRVSSLKIASTQPWGVDFFATGRNHREENGIVVRDLDTAVWVVEIASLDGLLKFATNYGEIIIKKSEYKELPFELEIYDGFRE